MFQASPNISTGLHQTGGRRWMLALLSVVDISVL
jgi:hypothetical protein